MYGMYYMTTETQLSHFISHTLIKGCETSYISLSDDNCPIFL